MLVYCFFIKSSRPTLNEAIKLLDSKIYFCRINNIPILKLVHGYGSQGVGGRLYSGLRKLFFEYQQNGIIGSFVTGENFSIFNPSALEMITIAPELRKDTDLEKSNPGISFLWI